MVKRRDSKTHIVVADVSAKQASRSVTIQPRPIARGSKTVAVRGISREVAPATEASDANYRIRCSNIICEQAVIPWHSAYDSAVMAVERLASQYGAVRADIDSVGARAIQRNYVFHQCIVTKTDAESRDLPISQYYSSARCLRNRPNVRDRRTAADCKAIEVDADVACRDVNRIDV